MCPPWPSNRALLRRACFASLPAAATSPPTQPVSPAPTAAQASSPCFTDLATAPLTTGARLEAGVLPAGASYTIALTVSKGDRSDTATTTVTPLAPVAEGSQAPPTGKIM